ncbi:MAG: colanic acid biosynthesis acetyltransferase WcaF, partial [Leptolyngbyaceae cyanobacterium]
KVEIGDYSWVGEDVTFYSLAPIKLGQHCVVSQKSYLCTGSHDPSDPRFALMTAPIVIENGAWVATDCFIAPGVRIGANALVGVRSSVFKDMPAQYVCVGSPCRPQKIRVIEAE